MKVSTEKAETIFGEFIEVPHTQIDPELYGQVVDYKRRVASKFKSIGKDAVPRIQGNEFYISLKLDGEHSQLFYEDGEIALLRPRGYAYLGLPCLTQAKDILEKAGIKRALFPGELYVKRPDGKRTRVFDVLAHTKGPKSQDQIDQLCFAPFDIQFLDDEVFVDFSQVYDRLHQVFDGTPLAPPAWVKSKDRKDIESSYRKWVDEEGAEGLMIRTDLTFRYKLKAQHTIDAAIIGYTASDDMVTSVLTALVNEDSSIQVLAPVEKGFSDIERADLLTRLEGLRTESDYMEVSRFHTPFFMVKPKLIIEFTCNDMTAERHNGQPVKKAVLNLKKGRYSLLRSANFVSPKHCVYQRFRDDKAVNPVDLRTAQVTDVVFIDVAGETQTEISFPEVDILKREVWTKETKGKVSVRKFLAWKTNKEAIDDAYTAYAFNYTDYSPGRKEPLKQDVRVSNSRDQILAILEGFREKNIKKGWVKEEG
ncbi:MAG: hypothetical protein QNK37_19335 [Acidobacteriota bacterium]|nr:hypothetical protein [Acidobacteriota bacterium]